MKITLSLTPEQTASLLKLDTQLRSELEQQAFPTPATVSNLKFALSDVLDRQAGFPELFESALHRPEALQLVAADTRLRNLPWQLALEDRPLLSLVKTHRAELPQHQPSAGLPLKVLVMVSAPEGATRLDHEAEELGLLRAFAPLMSRGLAQVHFTDDGSLENLQEKLAENRYHVLHFSGHGIYKDEKGGLWLENETDGKARLVSAREFNEALQKIRRKGQCPDLIVLSACQSAQGGSPGDLQGVADELLAGGIPAVIAMAASVLDVCATEFAAALYAGLAEENPLPEAFLEAVRHLREFEVARINRQGNAPGQWLIPQLLVSAAVDNLYDKSQKAEELKFSDAKFVSGDDRLLHLRGGVDRGKYRYVFIGRRRERRFALTQLRQNERPAVLLRGQGGVGKTALAEHLAVRLLAGNPRIKVFTHSERAPALEALFTQLRDYLTKEKRQLSVITELTQHEKLSDKFIFLLQKTAEYCDPLFIFDNLETFQKEQGGEWNLEKYEDVHTGLSILLQYTSFPVICTGRYPLREFPELAVCDLNAASFGDFYKKCWQLPMSSLAERLKKGDAPVTKISPTEEGSEVGEAPTFEQVCKILHRAFGGNYRALEFFDELYTQRGDAIFGTLERLDALPDDVAEELRRRMSANLVFGELLALLSPGEQEVLTLLAKFRIPVLPMALGMQRENRDFSPELNRLADLTLAERETGTDGRQRYYVMPLVQDLLADAGLSAPAFSEEMAGDYHGYVVKNELSLNTLTDHSEAFEWYFSTKALDKVNEVGFQLCSFYFEAQQFHLASVYGLRTEEVARMETKGPVFAILGSVFQIFGKIDISLIYKEKALDFCRKTGDRKGEGTMLNNISQIYDVKGDYAAALHYLEQSLKIRREIGDRKGEGATLSNISLIHKAKGDFDNALNYLEQSLKIQQGIGDRQGEGTTLNNLGTTTYEKGDYETALHYLEQSLKIRQEIADRQGEGTTLNNISQFYTAKGDYETALHYLEQSLKIQQEIGDRKGEGTVLNNISQIYVTKSEYGIALRYLEQSLKIRQEIGDTYGLAESLHNIGSLFFTQNRLEEAMLPLMQAYDILQKIGSPNAKVPESYLRAIIEEIGEARFQELLQNQ